MVATSVPSAAVLTLAIPCSSPFLTHPQKNERTHALHCPANSTTGTAGTASSQSRSSRVRARGPRTVDTGAAGSARNESTLTGPPSR